MLRVGIIGPGIFGQTQIKVFSQLPNVEVAAICGRDLEKTKRIAGEFQVEKACADASELISDPAIDLVSIVTPNHLHKDLFLQALKAGKHINLEKPIALNSKEVAEMLEAASDYDKVISIDHPMRFNPVIERVMQMLEAGELGRIGSVQISAYTNYVSADDKPFIWLDDPAKGGGQVLNMGTHMIDLLRYLFAMSQVSAGNMFTKTVLDNYPGSPEVDQVEIEHQLQANVLLDNGVNGTLFNTTTSFGYRNFEIRILGSKGIIFYDDISGLRFSQSNDQELTAIEVEDTLPEIQAGRSFVSKSFKYYAAALVDYVAGKSKEFPGCTLQQACESLRALENLQQG